MLQVGGKDFSKYDDHAVIARGETELKAARKAVEWMQNHPAPDSDQGVWRPELGAVDRQPMHHRKISDQSERIRVGSVVEVDALPPMQVTAELETHEIAPAGKTAAFEAELPSGRTMHLCVESIGIRDVLSYAGELTEYAGRTAARHVSVDNEPNLRESVDETTYEWLKERQGDTVTKRHGSDEHRFEVIEVDELRDGFLNPTDDGGLDPEATRSPGADYYIDGSHADQWCDDPIGLTAGDYQVVEDGVVLLGDTYAGNVVVGADEWDSSVSFAPTDTARELRSGMSNITTADRDGLDRTGDVTDLAGVGPKTAEKFWRTSLKELYHAGFPAVHLPAQYHEQAIADLHTLTGTTRYVSDACRAVVGILGGIGFDANGEQIATAASMISGTAEPNDMAVAWLSDDHDFRIKGEYTPSWVTGNGPDTVAAGKISLDDLCEGIGGKTSEEALTVTAIREHPHNDDLVGLITEEGPHVEMQTKPLKVMAAVANVDLSELDSNHVSIKMYPGTPLGEGVVLLNDTREPFNAVIDTDGDVDPKATSLIH
jgi:hypothetical protein